jgi:hypothetical protein
MLRGLDVTVQVGLDVGEVMVTAGAVWSGGVTVVEALMLGEILPMESFAQA